MPTRAGWVAHRDLKPENVLLTHGAAVLADFGVAKATAAARTPTALQGDATLTQAGMTLGTPAYMSPEQAAADPAIDHRADIYAWGILAYQLLAGADPFAHRESVQAMVATHLAEPPRPLGQAMPQLPPPLAALVMRCLANSNLLAPVPHPDHRRSPGRDSRPACWRHQSPSLLKMARGVTSNPSTEFGYTRTPEVSCNALPSPSPSPPS